MSQDLDVTPAGLHVLFALFGEDLHGYAIMKKVESMTEGAFRLGPGTLYRSLDRLLEAGLVRTLKGDDPRRIPYRITARGKTVVQNEMQRMRIVLGALEADA